MVQFIAIVVVRGKKLRYETSANRQPSLGVQPDIQERGETGTRQEQMYRYAVGVKRSSTPPNTLRMTPVIFELGWRFPGTTGTDLSREKTRKRQSPTQPLFRGW